MLFQTLNHRALIYFLRGSRFDKPIISSNYSSTLLFGEPSPGIVVSNSTLAGGEKKSRRRVGGGILRHKPSGSMHRTRVRVSILAPEISDRRNRISAAHPLGCREMLFIVDDGSPRTEMNNPFSRFATAGFQRFQDLIEG